MTIDKFVNNSWKQPIPVFVSALIGNRFRLTIFQHLLLRCANTPRDVFIKDSYIHIERGQCVVGRFEMAEELGMKWQSSIKIWREIKQLEKVNNLLKYQKSKNCGIVTIYDYDKWVSFETSNDISVKQPRNIHEISVNTNNSDEKLKSNKHSSPGVEDPYKSLTALSKETRRKIALDLHVDIPTVFQTEQAVLNPENIIKYKYKTTYYTVHKWISRSISRGEIKVLDDMGYEVLKVQCTPRGGST